MILFWVLLLLIAAVVGAFIARPLIKDKAWVWAALAGVAAPAVALAIYFQVGQPSLATLSGAPGVSEEQRAAEAMLAEIEANAEAAPDDVDSWTRLASAKLALGDFTGAAAAFERLIALEPEDAAHKSAWGEAILQSRGGVVTPEARAAFEEALAADPDDIRARYYIAEAKFQAGEVPAAIADWAAMAETAEAGSPLLVTLARRLERAMVNRERSFYSIGLSEQAIANLEDALAPPRGPTQEQVDAMAGMTPEQQQAQIDAMVAGLTARLEENPDDLEGWRMAARSFQTLGREEEWLNALAQVRRLSPGDPEALREHAHGLLLVRAISAPPDEATQAAFEELVASSPDDALALVGLILLRSDSNPDAETRAALEALLAADPADPIALLGLAQAARVDGDGARARELLARLVEGETASDALRREVQAAVETLPAE